MKSLLTQVRSIARQAAKAGAGWKGKSGTITCKNGYCTLAAIMFKQQEPIRKLQEEFEDLIDRAAKYEKESMCVATGDQLFDENYDVDKMVDPKDASNALSIDEKLAELVVTANDNSLKQLQKEAETARQYALDRGYTLSEYDHYQNAKRAVRAREILEEELFG